MVESVRWTPQSRLFLAMDVNDEESFKEIVESMKFIVGGFKIGLEAISVFGIQRIIEDFGVPAKMIFYDGKFNDIPNTVGKAVSAVSKLGVGIINVHASAGKKAMKAAVENKGDSRIFAVSVLTSLDDRDAKHIFGGSAEEVVRRLAYDAWESGVDGLICSPQEVKLIRELEDLDALELITPGVRPKWAAANDQERVTTPEEAIYFGSDLLVVGRPILQPTDGKTRTEAAISIIEEIKSGQKLRNW